MIWLFTLRIVDLVRDSVVPAVFLRGSFVFVCGFFGG